MSTYHFHAKIISRSNGRSSIGAAAYRSGEKLVNEYDGMVHDYTRKKGIVHSEIILPENGPKEFLQREVLWNSVEKIEKAKNAQLSREIEISLPNELSKEKHIKLLREYINNEFVSRGMCADYSIHDKGDGNPHAHIMLTTRSLGKDGEWLSKKTKEYILDKNGKKQYDKAKKTYKCKTVPTNDWNDKDNIFRWRENWARTCNTELEKKNLQTIDHRSYAEQGIEKIPSKHLGSAVHQMEKRGIETELGNVNRQISEQNKLMEEAKKELKELEKNSEKIEAFKLAKESNKYLMNYLDNKIRLDKIQDILYSLPSTIKSLSDKKDLIPQLKSELAKNKKMIEALQAEKHGFSGLKGIFNKKEKLVIDERLDVLQSKEKTLTSKINEYSGSAKKLAELQRNNKIILHEQKKIIDENKNNSIQYKKNGVLARLEGSEFFKDYNKIKDLAFKESVTKDIKGSIEKGKVRSELENITSNDCREIKKEFNNFENEKFHKNFELLDNEFKTIFNKLDKGMKFNQSKNNDSLGDTLASGVAEAGIQGVKELSKPNNLGLANKSIKSFIDEINKNKNKNQIEAEHMKKASSKNQALENKSARKEYAKKMKSNNLYKDDELER